MTRYERQDYNEEIRNKCMKGCKCFFCEHHKFNKEKKCYCYKLLPLSPSSCFTITETPRCWTPIEGG